MTSLFVVCGRANYTNLSGYSPLSERTFRRNLNRGIGFESVNSHLIQTHGSREGVQILVVDATFHEKSGRHTPNQDRFYNGKSGQVETGLEWSVVAVVDVEQNTAYALSAKLTEAGLSDRRDVAADEIEHQVCRNRVDFYLGHLAYCQTYVPKRVEYVVADSFYSFPEMGGWGREPGVECHWKTATRREFKISVSRATSVWSWSSENL